MFHKATREQAKLRLALTGPAGSGKTYSALAIAEGLGGKVALLDTENKSGELYSGLFNYDAESLNPPFTPQRYINVIKEAEKEEYDVLIIDSLSHAWAGEGGVLEMHDKATEVSNNKNSYFAWKDVTPHQNALIQAILQSSIHIIATMRTKTAYELLNENGKIKPVKIGLAPIQRADTDYEFTVVLDMSMGHIASATKDRTSLFEDKYLRPTSGTGEMLKEWLEIGVDPIKKSAEEMENLSKTMNQFTHLSNFKTWWTLNFSKIENLKPIDMEKIMSVKETLKETLS